MRRLISADGWRVPGAATHHVPGAEIVHLIVAATVQSRSAMMIRRSRSTILYDHRHLTGWRRWGWTMLVRTELAAHLVYDTARLLVTQDPESCRRLREQQMVWWTAVCARPNRDGHPS